MFIKVNRYIINSQGDPTKETYAEYYNEQSIKKIAIDPYNSENSFVTLNNCKDGEISSVLVKGTPIEILTDAARLQLLLQWRAQ